MQWKAAKGVRHREEKQTIAGKHGAYRIKGLDPIFGSFDMRQHPEERYDQVVRACCSRGIEVRRDQQASAGNAGSRGVKL
jgi:hypothetical protein